MRISYDPSTGSSHEREMVTYHSGPTATLRTDGRCWWQVATSAMATPLHQRRAYDPAAGAFTATGNSGRPKCTATLLPDGYVLFAGGGGVRFQGRVGQPQ